MALSESEKQRLGKMEFSSGGGYADFMTGRTKAKPSGSKFLFIGLGGKGSQTVAAIKTGVYKKIECPKGAERPDNFEYLIIDTDENEIKQLTRGGYGEIPLRNDSENWETMQLYDSDAAKKLKPDKRKLLPANIQEWLNPTINAELQGAGAGGIRQAGRYLLFGDGAFRRLQTTLEQKLGKLHGQIHGQIKDTREKLIVYIFAGVGGGTGSGTIIDVPYIIREICHRNNWEIKIHGYIFLPDTYAKDRAHQHYNSYAALKEIDTLMNIGQMGGAARFRATYVPGFTIDSTDRIFESCVLVSGKKSTGTVQNPDQYCRSVVVDQIVSLVSDSEIRLPNGGSAFLANSFLDNNFAEISGAVTLLPNTVPRNAYYQYLVIGTGEIILPIEQVMAYLAYGVMEKLKQAWNKHSQDSDVTNVLQKLHMLPDEQANSIESAAEVAVLQYVKGIGGPAESNDVVSGALYTTIKNLWMERNVDLNNAWDVSKNKCLSRILQDFDKEYDRLFQDQNAGIYYLRELLASRAIDKDPFNGILERIKKDYVSALEGLIAGQEEIRRQCKARQQEIQISLQGFGKGWFKQGSLVEEYREVTVGELVAENRKELYGIIVRDSLKQIVGHIESKLKEIQKYIDVFTCMQDIIDRNYRCVMENTLQQEAYASRLIDFSKTDDDTLRVLRYLDDMLSQETPDGLVTALEASILREERRWLGSEESFEPMKVFVQFLEGRFSQIPNLTIEKFITIKYGAGGLGSGIQQICNELKAGADVIFPTFPLLSLGNLPSHSYVVLPSTALNLKSNMASYAQSNHATVAEGSNTDSIVWYNLVEGVPLFAYMDIGNDEKFYENNSIAGMHLWESESANWKRLPALSNQRLWNNSNDNVRERELAAEVKADVDRYLEKGLIWQDIGTKLYKTMCMEENSPFISGEQVADWCRNQYLSTADLAQDGTAQTGSAMWNSLCNSFSQGMCEYQINIPTVFMTVDEGNLHEVLRMNIFLYEKLKSTYELYEVCEEIVTQANEVRAKQSIRRRNSGRFYEYVRNEIVQIQSNCILIQSRNGEQEALLYFENYTGLEIRFIAYWAVQQLAEKCSEEKLEELDEYAAELSGNHAPEAMARRKELSDEFMERCNQARESLKKLETKNALKDAGAEAMITEYASFYDTMISLRKG